MKQIINIKNDGNSLKNIILFLTFKVDLLIKRIVSIGKAYIAKDSWISVPNIFKILKRKRFGFIDRQTFKFIRNISIRIISFLIKKSPITGANNIEGESINTVETLPFASFRINLINKKYEKRQINQIINIGDIFIEEDKK